MNSDDRKLLELALDLGGLIQVTGENQARIHRLVDQRLLERFRKRYRLTAAGKSEISN